MVETPILFITFARPEYARQTWEGIKAAQPKTLYFYSNKGRAEKDGEVERNNEIRKYINEIDWKCDLHTWFREECVNAYDSIRGAVDWLFENEECGIVLEEDCVPTKAFFSFVDQMIPKFRNEPKVWCISGDNYLDKSLSGYDYFFSHYHWMYGWASWANRWHQIDWDNIDINPLIQNHKCHSLYKYKIQGYLRERQLKRTIDFVKQTKCWDYAFGYLIDINEGLTVHPAFNLIHNIGVCGENHNSKKENRVNIKPTYNSNVYIVNKTPPTICADRDYDFKVLVKVQYSPLLKIIINHIYYYILKLFKKEI